MQMKLWGNITMDFDVIDERQIKFSISGRYWRKNDSITVHYIATHRFQEIL
jgi:hypothetical protein